MADAAKRAKGKGKAQTLPPSFKLPAQGGLCGTLTVLIGKAEALAPNPSTELHCDPYCILRVGGDSKIKEKRSGVRKRTITPYWNELMVLDIKGADELEASFYLAYLVGVRIDLTMGSDCFVTVCASTSDNPLMRIGSRLNPSIRSSSEIGTA